MKKTVKKGLSLLLALIFALTMAAPAFAQDEQAFVSDSASEETVLSGAVAPQGGEEYLTVSNITIAADSTDPTGIIEVRINNTGSGTYGINWECQTGSGRVVDPPQTIDKGVESNSRWFKLKVTAVQAGQTTIPIYAYYNTKDNVLATANCTITVTAPTLTVTPSDIVIDLNYSNSATVNAVISNYTSSTLDIGYAVSGSNISASYGNYIYDGTEIIVTSNTPGTYWLYVFIRNPYSGYNIVQQSYRVTVKAARAVSSISIDTYPTKTNYYVGESFSSSGMVLCANYNDGTSEYITSGFTCSSPDMSTAGKKNVKVTYEGKSTSFYITVKEKTPSVTVSSISIRTNPSKTTYTVGESFNSTGLTLTAKYSDGTSKTISSGFTCSKPDMTTAGTKKVTVTYQGKTASFNIIVKEKTPSVTVSSISIRTNPSKTTYTVGETFDSSGLTINVYYSDGSSKTVKSGFTCSKPDMSTAGTKKVTVTYGGKTASFNITVKAKPAATLSSIAVKTTPNKTTYNVGETFNSSGLTLTAKYSDGTSKTISSGFTCSKPDMTTAGTKSVTVTYQGKTASFNITVKAATIKATSVDIIVEKDFEGTNKAKLGATVNPSNASYKSLVWSSSDPDVVAVAYDGSVTTMSVGVATITVTVTNHDGTTVSDSIEIEAQEAGSSGGLFEAILMFFASILDLLLLPFTLLFGIL